MLKLFQGRNALYQIVILILMWLLLLVFHSSVLILPSAGYAPLYDWIYGILKPYPGLVRITSITLISVIAGMIPVIMQAYDLSSRLSYLGGFVFVLLMMLFPGVLLFNPVTICALLLLIMIKRVFDLEEAERKDRILFEVSFLSGLGTLIFFPFGLTLLWLMITLVYMQMFRLRYVMFAILHYFLPIGFFFVGFYWTDQVESNQAAWMAMYQRDAFVSGFHLSWLNSLRWLGLAFLLLFVLLKLVGVAMNQLIHIRRYSILLLWLVFLMIGAVLWVPQSEENFLFLLFVPLSMLIAFLLKDAKAYRVYNVVILSVFVGAILYVIYKGVYAEALLP